MQSRAPITTHTKINLTANWGLKDVVQLLLCACVSIRGGEGKKEAGKGK